MDRAALPVGDLAGTTLCLEHGNQVLGRPVAKQLALVFLMVGDAMALHQVDKVLGCVARQRRATEVRVVAQEVGGAGVQVGEIAPASTRNSNFFGQFLTVVDQQYSQAQLAGYSSAEQAGGTRSQHDDIKTFHCRQCRRP